MDRAGDEAEAISLKILIYNDNIEKTGAAEGIRTPDPIITNDVLYRLSYCGDHIR